MFSRPYHHIPKTPAGFRILNTPKSYLRPFIFSRNPNPPLTPNPIPPLFDYNAPPTQCLPQIFEPTKTIAARAARTPKNITPLNRPKPRDNSLVTPRRKHGHKRFPHHLAATRPGLRHKGPHFRTPAQAKRRNAAVALDRLQDVACDTMQNGRMTHDDHVFLKQLEDLRLDQHRRDKLGDAREIIDHSEALTPERVREHAERDRQAAVRVEDRKKQEEELRRLQDLRRKEEERRRKEDEKRREEESRHRAAERVRLQEQRERELRAKKEAFRKAQEEAQRCAREQEAQRIHEEAQQQERLRKEELHRKAAQAGAMACFQLYDAKWEELKKSKTLTCVMLCEMPWPMFTQGCTSPDDISRMSMAEFIFHPLRTGMETKSRKERLKIEMLRFHPDKFNSHIVSKLRECDRERAVEIAGAVARILTNMMTEEMQR